MISENLYFSVIVPTFHEAKNITALVDRLAKLNFGNENEKLNEDQFELIIVDDNSGDGLVEIIDELSHKYKWLKLIVRNINPGLSESVIDGMRTARFPNIIIMDADLSHPPEKIPELLNALNEPSVDFVIGSRYVDGGKTDEIWPLHRKLISKLAGLLATFFISVKVKDPLSGFVAIKKNKCQSFDLLDPIGWKISLELIVKYRCRHIKEIPIHFAQRYQGKSKLTLKIAYLYFLHLKRLLFYRLFSS